MSGLKTYNVAPNGGDNNTDSGVPVGSVILWGSSNIPSQWLACDGSAISRSQYGVLFSVIGTTYGAGDGSTTFNIPDTRTRTVRGAGTGYALGSTGGADSYLIGISNIPYHGHNLTDPGHSHNLNNAAQNNQFNNGTAGVNRLAQIASSLAATNSATTGVTVSPSLRDASDNPVIGAQQNQTVVNPYTVMNYIIRSL
jgi:microcystin-dependent protein